ncbi:MAG: pre-peptidase [Planctomycetota bacterium]|nr:MAG: pre-peptidase [Planctomycetota bacterium]REJ90206.1 MAG: pre-peptidase [Planctomycetota bacterium]REK36035.1 MAG: pre-peptidase [Planctomycetota bacterium]
MIHPLRILLGLFPACLALCAPALADAPDVKALNPSGAQVGQSTTVKVIGKAGTAPVQAWCSRPGVEITVGEDPSELTVAVDPSAAPGLCWIRLHNAEGASALRPFMIGLLPEVGEEEPNNAVADANPVDAVGVTVNGVLHQGGEVDTFAVPLTAGQTLIASIESHRSFNGPMDGVLQVLSPLGFIVRQNDDDRGFDPQIVYTATEDGPHYVRVFAFPAAPNSSIAFAGGAEYLYRLTVTTGPFIDHTMPLVISDEPSPLTPQGWNLPESAEPVAVDLAGTSPAASLPYPGSWEVLRMPRTRGATLIEPVNEPVAPPAAISGTIAAPGEADQYRLQLTKGQALDVQVVARAFGSYLDPLLRITDAEGKQLQELDDIDRSNADVKTVYTAPADGEFGFTVSDRFGHGGERYVYALLVAPQVPDFTLGVEADRFVLKSGTPLEIPVTITRTAGFAAEIAFSIEGLPDGVTLAEARSLPEGDTAGKVTLKLEAPAGTTFSGPITIRGTSSEETPTVRTAGASLTGVPIRTDAIWLTVTPE